MWGDNLCGKCEYKQVNDNSKEVHVVCDKYDEDLYLYTFIGIYMDSEKCIECQNDE